jgi:uncharacterized protein YabE (DUF348 family)/3D (Asp-Asp-Asp) domain-containing protein
LLLLAVVGFRLFPQRDVTVLNNGQAYNVSATFDTEREAVAAADVQVNPGDRVLYATSGNHASIAIERARDVVVAVDGQRLSVRTQATTIGGALAEAGIDLHPGDAVLLNGTLTTPRAPLIAATSGGDSGLTSVAAFQSAQKLPIEVDVRRARLVTVLVDPMPVTIDTAAMSVRDVLTQLGITVREGDLVQPPLDATVTANMTVRLAKARSVNVTLNGKAQVLYTQAATVADVLKVLGVTLQPGDLVSMPQDAPVTNGMTLSIGTTTTTDEVVTEALPPPVVYESDPTMAPGQVRTIDGVPGSRTAHYTVTYKNGAEASRAIVPGSLVVTQPIPTRKIVGSKPATSNAAAAAPASAATGSTAPVADTSGAAPQGKLTLHVYATWYTAAQGAWAPGSPNWGKTYTGAIVGHGICATDPNVIPMGTHFYVPGYGECLAADIGGGIKGYSIDLGFPESVGSNAPWNTGYVDITILD